MPFEKVELPALNPHTLKPALNPILVVDGAGLEKVKAYLATPRPYVKDYETTVTETYYQRKARTLQLGDRDVQYVIDLLAFADGSPDKLWAAQGEYRIEGRMLRKWWEEPRPTIDATTGEFSNERGFDLVPVNPAPLAPVVEVLRPSMDSDAWLKIGYYLEFEYIVSKWNLGIRAWNFYDAYLAERLLHNGAVPTAIKDFWALDDAVARYFKQTISKEAQTTFNLKDPLTDEQIIYTALDVRLPWSLKAMQEPKIKNARIAWPVQIENDAVPAFGDMHINGLWVNPEKWQIIIDANEAALDEALNELDVHFIPLVGKKVLPDPERVAAAHAAFKLEDIPTAEEKDISDQIKAAKRLKNIELVESLTNKRTQLADERKARKAAAKEFHKSISYLATKGYADEVDKFRGESKINFGSADQVRAALFSGNFGLNEKNLPDLDANTTLKNHMGIPIIQALVKYKKIKKQLETYGYRWITPRDQIAKDTKSKHGFVDPDTSRIHPPFRQTGTDTGRPSCANPNVLNLPKEKKFREAFEARAGHMNVTKDCAGQELRILTQISGEPSWIEAFNTEKDVHSISAALISPAKWKEGAVMVETKMMVDGVEKIIPPCAFYHNNFKKCKCPKHEDIRGKYKAVNFGIAYDKQAYSLSVELGITEKEAQEILDEWKRVFKITQAALENLRNTAYERGEARTLSNRRRILSKVSFEQAKKRCEEKRGVGNCSARQIGYAKEALEAAVKREGGNMPIQGTGADMMKLAMGCGFDPDGKPFLWHILEPYYLAMMENYVYDEFMVETPDEFCDAVGGPEGIGGAISDAIIRAGAQFVTAVPMASEGAIAKTWTK